MTAEVFLDTNVLVYAAAGGDYPAKRVRAAQLLADESFGISVQVLQEFYVTVVRKVAVPLSPLEALDWIDALSVFPCRALDPQLVRIAIGLSESHGISYWDAAIVASAQSLGASVLYSEDLNDGQAFGSVRVCDPFAGRH